MNAAEQVTSFEVANKLAAIAALFKSKFPAARVDLKPWCDSPESQRFLDPESFDLGLHFPGVSRLLRARSILLQIRCHTDPVLLERRAIGIEASGHSYRGQCWRFSTIECWQFDGEQPPMPEGAEELRQFFRQILEVFS
ncbi:MAG: hypothetical protein HC919_01015 [Oscillatoriales cyanobacterium SM2_2_1]|nr:hypothetical protein [Oscillatoriales cyanobacterium SM2_2_1]